MAVPIAQTGPTMKTPTSLNGAQSGSLPHGPISSIASPIKVHSVAT
jgi:hypothetical protein